MTDLKCNFCDGCGTIKYEVIHLSIKNRDISRLYSIICNNRDCKHHRNNIEISAYSATTMLKQYQKCVSKLLKKN